MMDSEQSGATADFETTVFLRYFIDIATSREDAKILWIDDAEIVARRYFEWVTTTSYRGISQNIAGD